MWYIRCRSAFNTDFYLEFDVYVLLFEMALQYLEIGVLVLIQLVDAYVFSKLFKAFRNGINLCTILCFILIMFIENVENVFEKSF